MRRWLAIGSVAAWVLTLGWFLARERGSRVAASTAVQVERVGPAQAFYAVYAGTRQVGYGSRGIDTLPDQVRASEQLTLDLPAGEGTRSVSFRSDAALNRALVLRRFDQAVTGVVHPLRARGEIEAGAMTWSLRWLATRPRRVPPGRGQAAVGTLPLHPVTWPLTVAFRGPLETGKSLQAKLFDPMALQAVDVRVAVTADSLFMVPDSVRYDSTTSAWVAARTLEVRGYRVEVEYPDGRELWWIDAQGLPLAGRRRDGLRLERTEFELAATNYRSRRGIAPAPPDSQLARIAADLLDLRSLHR